MPILLEVLEDGELVVLTASGVVTERQFVEVHERFLTRPDNMRRLHQWLSDWTRADALEISTDAVRAVAETALDATRSMPHTGKVAVLVAGDLVERLAVVWQGFTEQTGWPTLVTRDHGEALDWLGRDRLPAGE